MDAAAAAAMSDPDRNRWFRRRWSEAPVRRNRQPGSETAYGLELTGRELLEMWRREMAGTIVDPLGLRSSPPGPTNAGWPTLDRWR
jgi:hypothetical protein